MSFVQHLRMRNMFPINSNLGSAKINLGGQDPMYEIINAYRNLQNEERRNVPRNGLQQVAAMRQPNMVGTNPLNEAEPLRFGGVRPMEGSNPGADILARSRASAEQTYANYGKPLNTQDVSGPSNDEKHLNTYFDRKNKEKVADATLANAGNKGWKVVNVTDPNNPSQTIGMRVNEQTGETQPLDTGGGLITRTGSVADIQKRQDAEAAKAKGLESARTKATEGLGLIDQLINPDGTLKPDTEWVTGWSANFGTGYTPKGAAAVGKINRLKNSLTLDLIKELKEQSRTGATGFGQMNLRELGVLENAASMLDSRNMSEEEYAAELKRIKDRLQMILLDAKPSGMKPATSHITNSSGIPTERIRVRNKQTGQTGTISAGAFNASKYDRVQ